MNLTNPLALLWAGLAIPIVIFYILKIRLRRVPVSTVIFWNQIFQEKQPRSLWQRFRHWLSLLMQLALLVLLVLALTDPFFSWQLRQAQRTVVVLDNSASMRATDVMPSRFEQARETAAQAIRGLRQRDEMAMVTAGTQPTVICGLTAHQRTLREALDSVPASDGPTRVVQAVELARRLVAGHPNGRVVVLTDGSFDEAAQLAESDDVQLVSCGGRTANLGITKLQVRRSLVDPIGYEILVEVVNHADEPAECRLNIDLDEQIVDVVPLKLAADGRWSKVLTHISADGGQLTATLDHNDALASDNTAYAILPRRDRQRIVLVSKGNLFIQRVFEAHPLVDLTVTDTAAAEFPVDAIVVFHRMVPDKLPDGRLIVIQPDNSTDHWQREGTLDQAVVGEQDTESPLMTHVRLDNVLIPEAQQLSVSSNAEALAVTATGHPLFFSIKRPAGHVVVLAVNLDRSDLPLRTAFPIMMSNTLLWLAGSSGELRESLATGAVARAELPGPVGGTAGAPVAPGTQCVVKRPDGSEQLLPDGIQNVTVGPLDQCGIWRLVRKTAGQQSAVPPLAAWACNLANTQESDLRPDSEFAADHQLAIAGWGGRPIWFYLLTFALVVIATEWFLYQRRWIS